MAFLWVLAEDACLPTRGCARWVRAHAWDDRESAGDKPVMAASGLDRALAWGRAARSGPPGGPAAGGRQVGPGLCCPEIRGDWERIAA
ncbi:MAG: hypothetical protein PHQ34_11580 [Methanothrix sp.]|nr:hypothetical protein [Methanothrix sp.]